jgi:FAD/FMN-containing dehydrogenase
MVSTVAPGLGDGEHVLIVSGIAMSDTAEEGHAALAPLDSCPVLDQALVRVVDEPTSIVEEFVDQYRANPEGHRYAADNAWIGVGPGESVPALRRAFTEMPGAKTFSLWFATYVVWEDAAEDDRYRAWLCDRMTEIEAVADGCYLGDSDFTTRPAKFVSDAAWPRFVALRERFDPDEVFVGYLGEVAHV